MTAWSDYWKDVLKPKFKRSSMSFFSHLRRPFCYFDWPLLDILVPINEPLSSRYPDLIIPTYNFLTRKWTICVILCYINRHWILSIILPQPKKNWLNGDKIISRYLQCEFHENRISCTVHKKRYIVPNDCLDCLRSASRNFLFKMPEITTFGTVNDILFRR